SRPVWSTGAARFGPDTYAWVESPSGAFPGNRRYFAEIKDVPFGVCELDVQATAGTGGRATLTIKARGHAYFVHVCTPEPGVRFSDNYFDLRDGDAAQVTVSGLPEGFDPKRLEVKGYAGQARRPS
ncbi:MAG TPA: glycoside hydrolase family 2 protein, partial [Actinopolymorphaceae bacterium]